MTAAMAVEAAPATQLGASDGLLLNGFHFACLVFQRARQLNNGSRPRLDAAGHKYLWVAMHEVRAGMVAWDVATVEPGPAKRG